MLNTLAVLLLAAAPAEQTEALKGSLSKMEGGLDALYRELHQNPELSGKEEKTAAKLAARLTALGFTVTTKVGGTGIVGVLKNGAGPTVLVRTDLDALPVEEKTALPYASTVTTTDSKGLKVGVMHACAHDMHMTVWSGTAAMLAQNKSLWHGTLVFIGQPAEETGEGAKAMIKDAVLTRFPKPDAAVALHVKADLPAGQVGFVKGYALANVDTAEVTLFGRGGHGSMPQATIDPIAMAAKFVLSLQTLVSRENSPFDPAVVTVGAIHGGTRPNIIADEVRLSLTLRSYRPEVRQALREGVIRIAKAEALAARAPKEPSISIEDGASAVFNDPAMTDRLVTRLSAALGEKNVLEVDKVMGGEDFGEYGTVGKFPSVMLWLGGVETEKFAEAKQKNLPLPTAHSALWAPNRPLTIRTGVTALTHSVMELMSAP